MFPEQPFEDGLRLLLPACPHMDEPQKIQTVIGQERLIVRDASQFGRGCFPIFVLKCPMPCQERSAGFSAITGHARHRGAENEPAYEQAEAGEADR